MSTTERTVMAAEPEPLLHPSTRELVKRFAVALAQKLAASEQKYGYTDGWASADWMDECRAKLLEHVEKGDPRDVAAYCAFLWHHGERTSIPAVSAAREDYEPRLPESYYRGDDVEDWGRP